MDLAHVKQALQEQQALAADLAQVKGLVLQPTPTLDTALRERMFNWFPQRSILLRKSAAIPAETLETAESGTPAKGTPQPLPATDIVTTAESRSTPAPSPEIGQLRKPGNRDLPRLMSRATQLLGQGQVAAARIVLEHAIEAGSVPALFALAETFDPLMLATWRTLGTQADLTRARDLYAKALAGGIETAKDRLSALQAEANH